MEGFSLVNVSCSWKLLGIDRYEERFGRRVPLLRREYRLLSIAAAIVISLFHYNRTIVQVAISNLNDGFRLSLGEHVPIVTLYGKRPAAD